MALKFFFEVLGLLVLISSAYHVNGRPQPQQQQQQSFSNGNTGGVNIFNDGRYLHCHGLVCPEPTERCVVSVKSNDRDLRIVETWKRCLDQSGRVLQEDRKSDINQNPFEAINIHVESGRNGQIISSSASNSNGNYGTGTNYVPGSVHGSGGRGGTGSIQQQKSHHLIPIYVFMLIYCVKNILFM